MSRSHFYVVASVPAINERLASSLLSASITLDREPHRNFHSAVSLKLSVLLFPTVNLQCCVLFAAAFIGHHLFDELGVDFLDWRERRQDNFRRILKP